MSHYEPAACFCCRRSAWLKQGKRARDSCLECSYVPGMPELSSKQLDVYEQYAIAEVVGGAAARFVADVGTTDLAAWSEEQAFEFAKLIFLGVGDSIRQQVRSGKPPF